MSSLSAAPSAIASRPETPACASLPPIAEDISAAVGATPLVRLSRLFPTCRAQLFAKLESVNPGGSTKDRPALAMVQAALADGTLAPGGTVVESSSGNLGVALARTCAVSGLRFVCVVDSRTNATTIATIRALGAQVEVVDQPDPVTGDLLTARRKRVRALLEEIPGAVNLNQYANPANPGAHRNGTMAEIAAALEGRVDVLLAAVSTTGTLSGCTAYLREHAMSTRTVAVDAQGSALFDGTPAPRPLPGFGAGMVTELSRSVHPDELVRVAPLDAVAGARLLARREGILAGASTGAIVHALAQLPGQLAADARVALIVHDSGVPYLETIYSDAWVRETLGASPADIAAAITRLEEAARA